MRKIYFKHRLTIVIMSLMMLFTLSSGFSYAQTQISGTVISGDNSKPLPGVNVVLKGTQTGTVTNVDGKYTIDVPSTEAVLVYSFIGFIPKEIAVGTQTTIDITMVPNLQELDQVVVIGYGAVKKSDLTGAVASITSKDFEDQPVTNISQALSGRVAGVSVTNNSGAPGGNVKIRIRGANSLLGNNNPLYIVDGVALNIGIGNINVNDIENIEVLKDASATAIYGSRGANGVVLITTKKGKSGKAVIQANVNIGISNLAKKYDLLDAGSFAELVNVYKPDHFTQAEIDAYKQNGGVDWQDEIFQTGISKDYQLNISGGNDKSNYYVSGNYLDQTGIINRTSQEKFSVRAKINSQLTKKFSLDFNIFAARLSALNNDDMGSKTNPVMTALICSPTFSIYTPEGVWNQTDPLASPLAPNPLMQTMERYEDFISNTLTLNTKLGYDIFKDLKYDLILGADVNSFTRRGYENEWMNTSQTTAFQDETHTFTWQLSNILTYQKNINKFHDITVTAVYEASQFTYSGFNARGTDVLPISVGFDNLGIAGGQSIGSFKNASQLQSYLGRVAYKFRDRYLITASYRADGSSKFQGDNKWGYFPSIGVAWRVSEEAFVKDLDLVSNLKFRAGWGVTGNQGVPIYATRPYIGTTYSTFGLQQSFIGSTIYGLENRDLKWETTEQSNVGVDLSVLNDRISFSADYYYKKTNNLFHAVKIPEYNGGGTINKNIGVMENKGFEFAISAIPVASEDFWWSVSVNLTMNENKLLDLGSDTLFLGGNYSPGLTQESPFAVKVGESLGSFWGYEWQGIYTTAEAAEAAVFGFAPGDNKYRDLNGDGVINSADKYIIGNALPKFVWGFSNSLRYKNFGLDIVLHGVHGNKVLNTAYAASATILSDATSITHVDGADYWTPENEDALFANPTSSTGKNFIESTQYLQDGSFIKIQNLALMYTLDKDIIKYGTLKISVSAQNLMTFTKYKGFDPEVSTSGASDIDGSIDVGAYPTARTFTFGLQLTF